MATKKTDRASLMAEMDTTFITHQRDMYNSGLIARIGGAAFVVWGALKAHADFETGESWPGIRRLVEQTGYSSPTVQEAIKRLEEEYMLRVNRLGKKNIYVPRERLDIRVGERIICTVVIDYVPLSMRERLAKLKAAAMAGDMRNEDVWAGVELIPGPGMIFDQTTGTFKSKMIADEVTLPTLSTATVTAMRERLRGTAEEMRKKLIKN